MQNSTLNLRGSLTCTQLNALIEELLRPLLELLGITLGGVEYQVMDIDEGGGELKI